MTGHGVAGGLVVNNRLGRGLQPGMAEWRRWCGGLLEPLALALLVCLASDADLGGGAIIATAGLLACVAIIAFPFSFWPGAAPWRDAAIAPMAALTAGAYGLGGLAGWSGLLLAAWLGAPWMVGLAARLGQAITGRLLGFPLRQAAATPAPSVAAGAPIGPAGDADPCRRTAHLDRAARARALILALSAPAGGLLAGLGALLGAFAAPAPAAVAVLATGAWRCCGWLLTAGREIAACAPPSAGRGRPWELPRRLVRSLLRRGTELDADLGRRTLLAASAARRRPSAWDGCWVAAALRAADGGHGELLSNALGLLWFMDRHEYGQAAACAARLEALAEADGVPPALRVASLVDAAFFAARVRQEPALARSLLERADDRARAASATEAPPAVHEGARLSAEAAILLAEGRREEAHARAAAALALFDRARRSGSQQLRREWLLAISSVAVADAATAEPAGVPESGLAAHPAQPTAAVPG
jgi:hypothetical protein